MNEEKINQYYELQKKMKELEEQLCLLKSEITNEMNDENVTKVTTKSGIVASVVTKELIKYNDEIGMIKYLKENNMTNYIVEKINATAMNKELKKTGILTESLNSMITRNISYSLTVKESL